MRDNGALPEDVSDAAQLLAAMRTLKQRSGRTYRELEERAAQRGTVLPRSTVADALRRDAVPRAALLEAFVRACDPDAPVGAWLAARDRAAAAPRAGSDAPPESARAASGAARRPAPPRYRRPVWIAATLVAVLATAGALALVYGRRPGPAGAASLDGFTAGERAVRLRPADAPDLCVSDGRDRARSYGDAVAVQRPCAGAEPPYTRLRAVAGAHQIWWTHPALGDGCLTVRHEDPARDLLEPWLDCRSRPAQLYRFLPLGGNRYRIRSHYGDACLTVAGAEDGAEVRRAACRDTPDEVFLVDVQRPDARD